MTTLITCLLPCLLSAKVAMGTATADFAKYFEVDLDAPIPDLKALNVEYEKETAIYNPRYILSWDMSLRFDPLWSKTISAFGLSETRLKNANENSLLAFIQSLPPEFYPYIGPQLHTAQGISEKIINLPGIKETKNKFPTRVAPQLADIEDLEFLSPYLYLLLMPEMWPENANALELPRPHPTKRPQNILPKTSYRNVMQNVPNQGYGGAARAKSAPDFNDLRTLKITKDSPLTSADIKAFLNTLPSVKTFGSLSNLIKLHHAETLLNFWEEKNNMALPLNTLKDSVNPCARAALKIKWAGLETEFAKAIAPQGFNLKEWAYTCDKTIKAHKVATISRATLLTLKNYKSGVYNKIFQPLKPFFRDNQFAVMQATIEMYKAPKGDVLEALKNEAEIQNALRPFGGNLLLAPINN